MNPSNTAAINTRLGNFVTTWARTAFAGLTPQVVAIVAVLLLLRIISSNVNDVVVAAHEHALDKLALRMAQGLMSLVIMAAPMLVVVVVTGNLGPQSGPKRIAALAAAVLLSTPIGVVLRVVITDWAFNRHNVPNYTEWLPALWYRYAQLGGLLTIVAEFYRREVTSLAAMHRAEIDAVGYEREMAEARLQVLQAQIEPHFLFNTLANVRRLYQTDNAAGRTMLESLMRYLEVALPRMRDAESTLERDATLIDAFLQIQQIRMGRRLAYEIDIPAELRGEPIPPMMLLTLVENAIKHGLNPLPEGGAIRVAARREGDLLVLSVADTGAGFRQTSGGGAGLANIRARLAALYGGRGALSLAVNGARGVVATLVLPIAPPVRG